MKRRISTSVTSEVRRRRAALERARTQRTKDAVAAWKALSRSKQLDLAADLVETRRDELRRAYRGVVAVTCGYGTRTRAERPRVDGKISVVFLVRRKKPTDALSSGDRIPEHVYTYVGAGKRKRLLAVPTDVECKSTYRVKSQSPASIRVTSGAESDAGVKGAIACIVEPSPGERMALSCYHVCRPTSALVTLAHSGEQLGCVTSFRGLLVPNDPISMDVALARIDPDRGTPNPPLRLAAPALKSYKVAPNWRRILQAGAYVINTPHGEKSAQWGRMWRPEDGLVLDYRSLGTIRMAGVVIESILDHATTEVGDSGSPVVTKGGRYLLCMPITGDGPRAFMLPASEILWRENYTGLSQGGYLELASTF